MCRALSSILAITLTAARAVTAPDFDRAVAPILTACLDCHSGADAKGKLDLSRKQAALGAVVPGKPAESELWMRVSADEMPPEKPLTTDEKATLKAWIEGGAKWGTDPIDPLAYSTATRAGRDWWALRPVTKVPPDRKGGGAFPNPVDTFILARLERDGLKPSPPADRRTLLRRLKFDLLGLPPTPEEVESFVSDTSADAYEKLVEKYLASPQYGERWARHWLDVVRFAESHGFETNTTRANAWPYRDWVIRALNDDMPYDRFVYEQLAGDTVGADAATGFLVAGAWDAVKSPDPVLTANQRADELHDIVSTVGATFLGLTVGCARCHTHKFDPIPQRDYYRLKAAFAGVQHGEREVRPGNPAAKAKRIDELRRELATAETRLLKLEPLADPGSVVPRRAAVSPRANVERFTPVTAKHVRMVIFATNSLEPCIDEFEVYASGEHPRNVALASAGARTTSAGDYTASPDIHRLEHVHDGRYGNGRSWIANTPGRGRLVVELPEAVEIDRVVWGRDREETFTDRLATRYRIDVSADGKAWQVVASSEDRTAPGSPADPPAGLSAAERGEWVKLTQQVATVRSKLAALLKADMAYVGRFGPPELVHRLHRGDPMGKREVIGPGLLSGVAPKAVIPDTASDAERRVAVARWVTDPANPLTPRVIVNRLWQHHFGIGLVATPSDFGFHGGRPSHPELLDWLACELVEHKWSQKHIHRLVVTSATYRQSSASNPAGLRADAGTRSLWRYPPRRLEAEAIRDSILAVSGKLDPTAGGPGFDLFEPNTNYVKVYTPKTTFGPAEFRRMVYQQRPRMQPDDTFGGFDCPDAGQSAPRRNSSTTPLQALNLLNSPFVVQQAAFFAERVTNAAGETPPDRVRRAFRLAFQREPTEKELSAAVKLTADHGLVAVCRALLNANEFLYVD
jgi:cytochrome c553